MTQQLTASEIDALIHRGMAAINSNHFAEAEAPLRQALQAAPTNSMIAHNLAVALVRLDRSADAEAVLAPVVQHGAQVATFMLLGEIFEVNKRLPQAVLCFEVVLKNKPEDYTALSKLAALKEKAGERAAAVDYYRRAVTVRPNEFDTTTRYADLVCTTEPEVALKLYEDILPTLSERLVKRAHILQKIASQKEWTERIRRGEMPWHCARVDELLFNYGRPYVVEMEKVNTTRVAVNPNDLDARIALASARFCLGDRHGAEKLIRSVGDLIKGKIYDVINFAPAFYERLRAFSDADLVRGLPPLETLMPPVPDANGTLYLSCNFLYFRAFALPMIVSLRSHSPQTPVHVHIMDATPDEAKFAKAFLEKLAPMRFALSVERPGLQNAPQLVARCYYHAVRFIRFYQHLKEYGAPLWLMDVDAVVNRDLGELFAEMKGADAAMRIRPARIEPWNQFNACVVGATQSPASMAYFQMIAAYTAHYFQQNNLQWGIDQLAMYGVFADMQDRGQAPELALLGAREVDYDYKDDGFIWCNSGIGKFKHLQRIQTGVALAPEDFAGNKFVGVFETYWKETERIAASLGVKA